MADAGFEMVRYADDFVILCRMAEDAQHALAIVQRWTASAGLRLHPEKTHLVDMQTAGGFDFLGYHFERGSRWPRKKSLQHLKARVRQQTRRNSGHSLAAIIAEVNPVLRGWFVYFKHSRRPRHSDRWMNGCACGCAASFGTGSDDAGRGRGRDHRRWPNRFFQGAGAVFSHNRPCAPPSVLWRGDSSTGEPDAGDPPVRFGGRGIRIQSILPTPIHATPLKSESTPDVRNPRYPRRSATRDFRISAERAPRRLRPPADRLPRPTRG